MALAVIMASGGKRLARTGKRPERGSAIVPASQFPAGTGSMDRIVRKFVLARTRSTLGAIIDVTGSTGCWPFRRCISYHVGVNCDAISVRDGLLHVQRRGRIVAIAESRGAPSLMQRLLRSGWSVLLHPRHARDGAEQPQGPKWEDLLRSRRPK
jgi:hypothetical protein